MAKFRKEISVQGIKTHPLRNKPNKRTMPNTGKTTGVGKYLNATDNFMYNRNSSKIS